MTPSSYNLCLYKPASTAQRYRGWLCYVLLSVHVLGTSPNADEMKADTAIMLNIKEYV